MTRTGRNNTAVFLVSLFLVAAVALLVLFVTELRIVSEVGSVDPTPEEWRAVAGALVTTVISFTAAIVYIRLFRRSPSVPVFFVVLFLIFTAVDVSKLGQVMIPATAWRNVSPVLARVTIFGHMSGALALFAAGLYASVSRMQQHGIAMTIGLFVSLGLSWAVPIDTFSLPHNLVYTAGFQPSLDVMIQVVFGLAVVNFLQAAVTGRERRQVMSALAVALVTLGREVLYYRTEVPVVIGGAVLFVAGVAVYAVENYRDYLVS